MVYPSDKTLFPPEIIAPRFRWQDTNNNVNSWLIWIQLKQDNGDFKHLINKPEWTPEKPDWDQFKKLSRQAPVQALVLGFNRSHPQEVLSKGGVVFSTSDDETGAPIFYREVNLPFIEAVKDPTKIRWCFGDIGSPGHPKVVSRENARMWQLPLLFKRRPMAGNGCGLCQQQRLLHSDADSPKK